MARQKPQYNTRQVLELAIEVDKLQGFVKSGFGYFDKINEKPRTKPGDGKNLPPAGSSAFILTSIA